MLLYVQAVRRTLLFLDVLSHSPAAGNTQNIWLLVHSTFELYVLKLVFCFALALNISRFFSIVGFSILETSVCGVNKLGHPAFLAINILPLQISRHLFEYAIHQYGYYHFRHSLRAWLYQSQPSKRSPSLHGLLHNPTPIYICIQRLPQL